MKYKLYRSFGDLDKDVTKHELVAVEYGKDIDEVTEAPGYEKFKTVAYAPEPVKSFRRVKRYAYEMTGIVYPTCAEENILIDYGIVEEAE